ncbi:MAG: threonylcarbamoyl-AMP synthase [Marinilabiliales bacterium]|nr:MAG: threonylcarbamoyl-AMP synthase [Marinilabiliales bacterium]
MLLKIHPANPSARSVEKVVRILEEGGLIIYPTDTVYGLGCDIYNTKAVEKVARIKELKLKHADFSFICHDFSHLSEYTKPIAGSYFKMLRKNLPGPFTFILPASSNVPKLFKNKKKTVGIRIPDNNIILEIVRQFGRPILTTSIHDDDEVLEYTTDPELIHEKFKLLVDVVIDGGFGNNIPSTVVDCTGDDPLIVRQGRGELKL